MDDKTGALEKLKAIMAKAEQVDMSSVKIGDIIYVPLDEEDGLILKDGYKDRNKYIGKSSVSCPLKPSDSAPLC